MKKARVYAFPENKKQRKEILKQGADRRIFVVRYFKRNCLTSALLVFTVTIISNYKMLNSDNIKNIAEYLSYSIS